MVSHNSVYIGLGLMLIAFVSLPMTHSTDPNSLESYGSSDVKNDDIGIGKRPFYVGSRYGRSPRYHESKSRKFGVAPRSDRFFLGSRYGKRSDELPTQNFEQASFTKLNPPFMMSCIYTGIKNFYRCSNTDEINDVINELSFGQNETDE